MPKTRKLQLSFAGGEIDTQMYGRIDAQQYQSGLATCKNWLVDPRGSIRRRPGFQRVASSLDSTKKSRLIPFTFSVDQQVAVELTDQKARFHTNGATIVWADFKEFQREDINRTDDTIGFVNEHGFVDGDAITFYAEDHSFSFLPTPFSDPDGDYFVRVVDSKTIQVFDQATGGSVVQITSLGTVNKKFYAFKRGSTDGFVGGARIYKEWDNRTTPDCKARHRNGPGTSRFCLDFTAGQDPGRRKFEQGESVELVDQDGNDVPGIPKPLYVDRLAGNVGALICGGGQNSQSEPRSFGLRTKLEYVNTLAGGQPNTWINDASLIGIKNNAANNVTEIYVRQYWQKGDLAYLPGDGPATTGIPPTEAHRVVRIEANTASAEAVQNEFVTQIGENSSSLESDGAFSVVSPFLETELFDIEYDQSGDIVTLTHPNHQPQELRRYDTLNWDISAIDFSPKLPAPTLFPGVPVRGQAYLITKFDGSDDQTEFIVNDGEIMAAPFAVGDTVYIDNTGTSSIPSTGYYSIANVRITTVDGVDVANKVRLRAENGESVSGTSSSTGTLSGIKMYYTVTNADPDEVYVVTAVDERGQESFASNEETVANNVLASPGASNDLQWTGVPGARSYNVYKKLNGLFGFIGQVNHEAGTPAYQFKDDNIGPDFSQTLLIPDEEVDESFQPRASARFEQRRCFGGSDALPRTLFMSRSGTESSFSYRLPTQADDRISVDIASREAHVIRHIVPVQDLLLMTQQGEFRVTAINSDAITPSTIALRQQSYVGSNSVHPQVVNNSVVFCSARGGHAREINFRIENQGYLTGDLSLRASHLFDGFTLNDLAYSKAPVPILWFVSSTGKLLCLTYIPEERVLAWHQHETEGTIESVCSLSEGSYDNIYVVVLRGSNRSIERLVQVREEELKDAVYLDASVTIDGTYTGTGTLSVQSTALPIKDSTVTITSLDDAGSTATPGIFSIADVGSAIEFTSGTSKHRVTIDSFVSATQLTGTLQSDFPGDLINTPTSTFAFARKEFVGFAHLANQVITVLVDGERTESVTVSDTGTVTFKDFAVKICGGLSYTSQAKTLPMSLEIEAGAQGRTKNVNQLSVRVEDCGALKVGMDEADTKSVEELKDTELKTGEFRTHVPSTWDEDTQVVIEASGAAPASVLNITTQISIGD